MNIDIQQIIAISVNDDQLAKIINEWLELEDYDWLKYNYKFDIFLCEICQKYCS